MLYIVYREYLHRNPRVQTLSPDDKHYQQYVERRLRQLYPTRGYDGMMGEAVADVRRFEQAWTDHERMAGATVTTAECQPTEFGYVDESDPCGSTGGGGTPGPTYEPDVDESWTGNEEHPNYPSGYIPSIQQEIDSLQAEPEEVERIYYYESLAAGTYNPQGVTLAGGARVTIDDLIRAAGEGETSGSTISTQDLGSELVAGAVALGLAGYFYWRIEQSARRAVQRTSLYFPGQTTADDPADAFRHAFLSVLLRRYCTAPIAHMVTDDHENRANNPPTSRVMDLHNNDLGREVKYHHFRGHWLWDRWDWKEWSRRVRDYINNPANAEFIPEWNPGLSGSSTPPDALAVYQRAGQVPGWKYIYFAPPR